MNGCTLSGRQSVLGLHLLSKIFTLGMEMMNNTTESAFCIAAFKGAAKIDWLIVSSVFCVLFMSCLAKKKKSSWYT